MRSRTTINLPNHAHIERYLNGWYVWAEIKLDIISVCSVSLPQMSNTSASTWECSTCWVKNDASLTKCRSCETKRFVDPVAEEAARKTALAKFGVSGQQEQKKIEIKLNTGAAPPTAPPKFGGLKLNTSLKLPSSLSLNAAKPADSTSAGTETKETTANETKESTATETKDSTATEQKATPGISGIKFKAFAPPPGAPSIVIGQKRKEMESQRQKRLTAEQICPLDKAEEQNKEAAAARAKVKPCPVAKNARGQVLAWGAGEMAQLGMGVESTTRKFPGPVMGELATKDVIQVCTNALHNLALTKEGHVYSWGCNDDGALGRETEADGKLEYVPMRVLGPLKDVRIVQVACGASHSLALAEDGTVYSWGAYRDASGLVGFDTSKEREFVPKVIEGLPVAETDKDDKVIHITAGESHSLACTRKGHVYYWGDVFLGRRLASRFKRARLLPQKVTLHLRRGSPEGMKLTADDAFAVKVFAGGYTSFVIAKTGVVWVWGPNNYGQCGIRRESDDPSDLYVIEPKVIPFFAQRKIRIAQIACSTQSSLALAEDGRVFGFGRVEDGRLGHGPENVYADAHEQAEPLLIEKLTPQYLSSEESWNEKPSEDYKGQIDPRTTHMAPDAVTQVACAESHSLACTARGRLFAWGAADVYQLGTGNELVQYTPHWVRAGQITQFPRAVMGVAAGSQHSVVVARDMADKVDS